MAVDERGEGGREGGEKKEEAAVSGVLSTWYRRADAMGPEGLDFDLIFRRFHWAETPSALF